MPSINYILCISLIFKQDQFKSAVATAAMHLHTLNQVLSQLKATADPVDSFGGMDGKVQGECAPESLDKK